MSRTSHLGVGVALGFICFCCCIMGLLSWFSMAEGPLVVGDVIGSVLIIGGIFSLASWGAVRNFKRAFHVARKECAAAPETDAMRSKPAPETADEKLAYLVSKPNHESRL